MGLFSFLSPSKRSSPSEIFEKELAELQLKIERHETRLQSIRARERGTATFVTIYSFSFWFIYGILWYFGWGFNRWTKYFRKKGDLKNPNGHEGIIRTGKTLGEILEAFPIILIPIGLIFVRRFFKAWYQYKQESEQVQLTTLKKTLGRTVEELKKQTSYNTTRELIERYDDKSKSNPQNRPSNPIINRIQPSSTMSTPNSQTLRQRFPQPPGSSPSSISTNNFNPSNNNSISPSVQPQHQQQQNQQLPRSAHQLGSFSSPNRSNPSPSSSNPRGWADRFANVLLGDDEGRPESKYALICKKCFSHNGLVLKEELDQIQYRCPHCGNFNPSKKQLEGFGSPNLPTNSTSEEEEEEDKSKTLTVGKSSSKNKKYQQQGRHSIGISSSKPSTLLESSDEGNQRRTVSLNDSKKFEKADEVKDDETVGGFEVDENVNVDSEES